MGKTLIILIGGPTASGKSALALRMAERHNGVIINADSMQIYSGLPILSSQPSQQDMALVSHHLYGALPPETRSSAGIWLKMADETVEMARKAGKTPILVGGTGLYFSAFSGELSEIPDIPDEVRSHAQQLYGSMGTDEFRKHLTKLDPGSTAKIKPNDRQRLLRAFEVAFHTGRPLGEWHKCSSPRSRWLDSFSLRRILILPPRDRLYAACDKRFLGMLENGGANEAAALLSRKLDPALPVMKTIGLREIAALLAGQISQDEAISAASQATRNYAKRQMTWFRNRWKADAQTTWIDGFGHECEASIQL